MAKQEEEGKNKTVLIAVDGSEHSDRAFDCEYENGFPLISFVTRLKSCTEHTCTINLALLHRNYWGISSEVK